MSEVVEPHRLQTRMAQEQLEVPVDPRFFSRSSIRERRRSGCLPRQARVASGRRMSSSGFIGTGLACRRCAACSASRPSGYYAWLRSRLESARDAGLLRLVRASFIASHGHLRRASRLLDLSRGRRDLRRAPRRPVDAARPILPALHGSALRRWFSRQALGFDPQSPPATVHGTTPNKAVRVHGYHLHSDVAGLALPGRVMDLFRARSSAGPQIRPFGVLVSIPC